MAGFNRIQISVMGTTQAATQRKNDVGRRADYMEDERG